VRQRRLQVVGQGSRQKALAVSAGTATTDLVALILDVRQLAARAGGLRPLKQLVDVLAE
jgi:hypothetical protein